VQQVKSPTPINDGFVPGTYLGPDGSQEFITVSGPGVTEGGATEWSIAPGPNYYGCLFPYNATWYDVGLVIKNSPIYARLQKAGIKSTQYFQFGVGSSQCGNDGNWNTNSLLGFYEVGGNSLVVASFTTNDTDKSMPVETRTYKLQP
jgi:hypothetical protein